MLRKKSQDFQASLNRFADLNRDPISRAKHFKNAFEALNAPERRQLIEGFSLEVFHLVDQLFLSHYDSVVSQQTIDDMNSALWILGQVFRWSPELVGKGWQKHGIEFVLKMVLHPSNAYDVRLSAIRLFVTWFQLLANYGQTTRMLDIVFQCFIPHFPLRNHNTQTEQIMMFYCEGITDSTFTVDNAHQSEPRTARALPIFQKQSIDSVQTQPVSASPTNSAKMSLCERADTLQRYLDKFLEYTTRETVKIDWIEPSHSLDSAQFMLDRVIVLYIYEVFPDAESNGIDIFGGWEGNCDHDDDGFPILDTIDPIIIARYWLIRWIINIASEASLSANSNGKAPPPGLSLFKQALFSSQKAINVLLTLMREAFRLPLACAKVIDNCLELLRHWLLQREFPPFVESGLVSIEDWTILLIHMLFSFFRSPYLITPGDRLQSAISITHSILQIVRDFANPSSTILARTLAKNVWQELIKELSSTTELVCSKSDSFGQATNGGFTRTLLSIYIFVRVIREIDLNEQMWDDALSVFRTGIWDQMVEQWARVVDSMTRALILNLFAIDIGHQHPETVQADEVLAIPQVPALSETTSSNGSYRNQPSRIEHSSESGSGYVAQLPFLGEISGEEEEHSLGTNAGHSVEPGVVQSTGNVIVWLRAWMRVLSLVDPTAKMRHAQLAVQTIGRAIDMLTNLGCANQLIHWLCAHILCLNVVEQPHAITILCNVLIADDPPPLLERAYILSQLLNCLRHDEVAPLVLDNLPALRSLEDMAIISNDTITTLQKLVRNQEFSSRAIRVATLLSLNHPDAEKILLSLLEQRQFQIDNVSLVLCLNALSLLILERADAQLFDHLFKLIMGQQNNQNSLLPMFCNNLNSVLGLGFHSQLVYSLIQSLTRIKNVRIANELKWQLCAVFSKDSISLHWSNLADKFLSASDDFFEGFVLRLSGQYPLPGFPASQWNSLPVMNQQKQPPLTDDALIYMETDGSILSLDKGNNLWSRTYLGNHCYTAQTICIEEESDSPVEEWLDALASSSDEYFLSPVASVRKKSSSIAATIDPFQDFPRPAVNLNSFSSASGNVQNATFPLFDISGPEMLQFIQSSSRCPEEFHENGLLLNNDCEFETDLVDHEQNEWVQFISSFGLLGKMRDSASNFHREIRHLDSAFCREMHKVAVIYVAKDQNDKHSILANTSCSENFERFVDGLGWMVQIGSPYFHGYSGGLPNGQQIPYYCSANTELIFHVSTMLNGDNTQRLKHLGNDEVHVVWSENTKPYRRGLIATRFCDVLIVLYLASPVLLRVHIEVQDQRLQFGPLFDGACIHVLQAASLVRETVLNASRAYRNLRTECDRPNKHREKVFREKKQMLKHLPLTSSIIQLYATPKTKK